ncbi:hypothetical protein [Actinokineospora sp.]|uniref:hypothetical protein n=1 Tax=Actinokineospora sp. TaxID=1872133 RepID=UPI003D6BEF73
MNESIFGHMESSLQDYLSTLSTRATESGEHAAAELARGELPRIVSALQALLDEHHPDAQGRCPTCRTRLFTKAPAPCRAYLTAHLCLLMTEESETPLYR